MTGQLRHILSSSTGIHTELVLFFGLLLLVLLQAFLKKNKKSRQLMLICAEVLVLTTLICTDDKETSIPFLFNGLLEINPMITLGKQLVLIATLVVFAHLHVLKYDFRAEALILIVGISLGLCFLLMANHILSMFISMEMVSLCSYVLVAFQKKAKNLEAGIKYLIFGATATAFMLFGASILFGITGSMQFTEMGRLVSQGPNALGLVQTALFMTLAGPFFKLAAVPFHLWAPDVYESTPTPLISYLAIAPKIGGLFMVFKLLEIVPKDHSFLLGLLIILSILVGNFAALSQTQAKRMMGYSGIAQAGFILIGMLNSENAGVQASVFYLTVFVFANTGTFLLIDILKQISGSNKFKAYAGLGHEHIFIALLGFVFMVSLIGLPPTGGFMAKFLVFSSLWEKYSLNSSPVLLSVLVFGLLNTAISIYYYFKIPYFMLVKKAGNGVSVKAKTNPLAVFLMLFLCSIVLALFFNPEWVQNRF